LRVYTYDQVLYLFGTQTIESWWNSGLGNPPFDRIEGGVMEKGLGAVYSVANNDENIFFLGDNNQVYVLKGYNTDIVSSQFLVKEFDSYSVVDDAIGWCMTLKGQDFYVLTFPTANKTWVYPIGGQWFEWSSGVEGGRNRASAYAYAYNKHIVEDHSNGNLLELDFDSYTENGSTFIRQRETAPLYAGIYGAPGKRITMNSFQLFLEVGVGITTGQGSDPEIMLQVSDDGGKTFSTEIRGTIGKIGEYEHKVEWFALGSFENRVIRIRVSDPVYICILDAKADIEVGI